MVISVAQGSVLSAGAVAVLAGFPTGNPLDAVILVEDVAVDLVPVWRDSR